MLRVMRTASSEHRRVPRAWIPCVLLLAGLTALAGCGGQEGSDRSGPKTMEFRVDPELLGPAVTDSTLRLTFRPPAVFKPGDPERVRMIREVVRREQKADDPMAIDPVLIFGRPDAPGSVCTVSRFTHPPEEGLSGPWLDLCRTSTRESVAPATVLDDLYRVGDVSVLQFLIQSEQMVVFRLICQGPGPQPIRIDYLVPRAEYPSMVRAIESSIGSLVLF